MRRILAATILAIPLFQSCGKDPEFTVDEHPRVLEVSYNTPPRMLVSYYGDRIRGIDWYIHDTLLSHTSYYYTGDRVDSSIFITYIEGEFRLDSVVSYFAFDDLGRVIRRTLKDVANLTGLEEFEDYHYNGKGRLACIEKYDNWSTNALVDSLVYGPEGKLKAYMEYYASYHPSGITVHGLREKYEVIRQDEYANPFYHINLNLGVFYRTDFGYMTENNLLENTIVNDTPQTYNTADLAYDEHMRVVSISGKIFFRY